MVHIKISDEPSTLLRPAGRSQEVRMSDVHDWWNIMLDRLGLLAAWSVAIMRKANATAKMRQGALLGVGEHVIDFSRRT